MLDVTAVIVSNIFKGEGGGGGGGGKEDGDCVDKDRDGVQSILSSTTTTMMVSVLTSETIVNNSDSNVP